MLRENDIRSFLVEYRPKNRFGLKIIYGLSLLFGFLAFAYIFLNYNALLRIVTPVERTITVQQASNPVVPAPLATPTPTPEPIPSIPESTLSFSGLNISAPINWDTPFDDKLILEKLPNGIVHFQGTAKPGQKGYTVITGHSSNYPWIKGQYNSIFAPLHNAAEGQIVLINYQNREYSYKVTRVFQIKPTEVSILQHNGTGTGIRLITCTPIGTSLRRLVVEAEQISPNPENSTPFQETIFQGELPDIR